LKYSILNLKFWLLGNIKKYIPFLNNYIRTTTSIISINYKLGIVDKETLRYLEYNVVQNEIYWLNKLNSFEHTPNIINYNKNKITLSYAGEPITNLNLPKDWEKQVKIILDKLTSIHCSHNDIKPTDLLILNQKIMLIDFQWANNTHMEIPSDWPESIGGRYKHPQKFNDSYSFYKSIRFIKSCK
tara:strand:- start:167 stop:721 length:555 start_codon:yes stop_codon:yes gene_type:complete